MENPSSPTSSHSSGEEVIYTPVEEQMSESFGLVIKTARSHPTSGRSRCPTCRHSQASDFSLRLEIPHSPVTKSGSFSSVREDWESRSATTEFEEDVLENIWEEAQTMPLGEFQDSFSKIHTVARHRPNEYVRVDASANSRKSWSKTIGRDRTKDPWTDVWKAALEMSLNEFCTSFTLERLQPRGG